MWHNVLIIGKSFNSNKGDRYKKMGSRENLTYPRNKLIIAGSGHVYLAEGYGPWNCVLVFFIVCNSFVAWLCSKFCEQMIMLRR